MEKRWTLIRDVIRKEPYNIFYLNIRKFWNFIKKYWFSFKLMKFKFEIFWKFWNFEFENVHLFSIVLYYELWCRRNHVINIILSGMIKGWCYRYKSRQTNTVVMVFQYYICKFPLFSTKYMINWFIGNLLQFPLIFLFFEWKV
jgi:hypothetical protein